MLRKVSNQSIDQTLIQVPNCNPNNTENVKQDKITGANKVLTSLRKLGHAKRC